MKDKIERIAIPVFGTRVSPRFDFAQRALIIDVRDKKVDSSREVSFDICPIFDRLTFLLQQGVQVLICGGIRRCDYFALANAGITVFPGLVGEVDELMEMFFNGDLPRNESLFMEHEGEAGRNPGKGYGRGHRCRGNPWRGRIE